MLRRAAQQLGALQAAPSTSGVGEAAFASLAGRLCTAWGVQGIHSSAAAWAKAPAAGGAAAKKATKKGAYAILLYFRYFETAYVHENK